MKTPGYLRFSLLIPLVVWGISLALLMATSAGPVDKLIAGFSEYISAGILLFFGFYVMGIIIWIFPYLLLALILFFSTFIAQARTALKLFALSPLAMTLLTLAVVTILDLTNSGSSGTFSSLGGIDQDFINFNLWVAALSLVWGYICVGIGYGIYSLLQQRGVIKEEASAAVSAITINS